MAELTIDTLAPGGEGVGRLDGMAVFVPLAAPGDRVRVRLVQQRRRFARAEVEELLQPGTGRRSPPCPVYGRCGGCDWQHLEYGEQRLWKQRLFLETLQRLGGWDGPEPLPILGADREWGYRSRVQFKCHATVEGCAVGFFRRGTHFVIDVESCPIAHPEINRTLHWLRAGLANIPGRDCIPQVDVEHGCDGQIRLVAHLLDHAPASLALDLERLAAGENAALFVQRGRKATLQHHRGPAGLAVEVDTPVLRLQYDAGGFAQVNPEQNRRLVDEVLGLADLQGGERVLDLYCGMGNLSLPLARRCSSLVGIEVFEPAIRSAGQNAAENGIGNCRFITGDALAALPGLLASPADLLVVDPPRQGARELQDALRQSEHLPGRLIYVSCDPATLARDLAGLGGLGYRPASVRAIDMFPQTHHTEGVVLLER